MFGLLLKRTTTQLGFLHQNAYFVAKSFTSINLSDSTQQLIIRQKHSFTAPYLINSCGLSPKSALLASQKVHFEKPDKPDSVLNLLRENGFSNTQISQLVRSIPQVLTIKPEKTLLPKIEFFLSKGVSSSDLTRVLCANPSLLGNSLKKHIIPCYDFLKSVLLVDEKVLTTLKRSPPSVEHTRFVSAVQEVKEMGFDPSKTVFVQAIHVLLSMSKPMLDSKLELYERWGWSEDVALLAFKRQPNCMLISEDMITKAMDFLVNKLGWPSADIARSPSVLFLSLEKRIIPRCSVIQLLQAKGLLKNDLSLSTFILPSERCFLEKFVIKFQDKVPQLWNVYRCKTYHLEVGHQSEKVC
ncbi:hypothetical protein ACB092_10G107500 [Castanea dentata]